MKRLWLSCGGALVVFGIALPVSADAPVDQYAFFDSSTPTITDNYTKLVWDRQLSDPYPVALEFGAAKAACEGAGKRLPTLKELLTIVDEAPHTKYVTDHNEPRYIDANAFDNTPKLPFWTSSVVAGSGDAYTVDFSTGFVAQASVVASDSRNVRCVQ